MAILQAGSTRIYKGATAHSDMTTEACAEVTATRFQVTDKAKRFLDESHAFTVFVNGSSVSATTYSLEYPGGFIVFAGSQTGKTVTITGGYFAVDKAYLVNGVDSEYSFEQQDITVVGDTAARNYPTLMSGKLTINGLHEDATWFARGGGRYIIVDSDSGTYDTDHIDAGTRWEYYARLSDDKVGGMNAKDVLRDTLTLESDGPVYYRSD